MPTHQGYFEIPMLKIPKKVSAGNSPAIVRAEMRPRTIKATAPSLFIFIAKRAGPFADPALARAVFSPPG